MRKFLCFATLAAIFASLLCVTSFAADSVTVRVSISNGTLEMAAEPITVTDTDGDGELTLNDALFLAHEAAFDGGASAGYLSESSEWGLSLVKLWGVENGGSYGYYINNNSASSLLDVVHDGDYVYAYAYSDTAAFSDTYCYFDVLTINAAVGSDSSVSLTLSAAGFDENWAPVVKPVEGAVITIDGNETVFTTDAEGKVILTLDITGKHIISAKSSSVILVPPVCVVEASDNVITAPQTGDCTVIYLSLTAAISALILLTKKKQSNEK